MLSKIENPFNFCEGWSEDNLCQFWWRFKKKCDLWKMIKLFQKIQYGIRWHHMVNLAWYKESNGTSFLNIRHTWVSWPVGDARALKAQSWNLVKRIMRLSPVKVPNLKTVYITVLGASIDSNGRKKKMKMNKQQGRNTMGCLTELGRVLYRVLLPHNVLLPPNSSDADLYQFQCYRTKHCATTFCCLKAHSRQTLAVTHQTSIVHVKMQLYTTAFQRHCLWS